MQTRIIPQRSIKPHLKSNLLYPQSLRPGYSSGTTSILSEKTEILLFGLCICEWVENSLRRPIRGQVSQGLTGYSYWRKVHFADLFFTFNEINFFIFNKLVDNLASDSNSINSEWLQLSISIIGPAYFTSNQSELTSLTKFPRNSLIKAGISEKGSTVFSGNKR